MTTTPLTIEAGPTDATPTGSPTRPGEHSYDFDMPLGEAKAPTAQNHQWLNRKNESFVRTHRATSHQVDNFDPWRITPACIVPLGWPTGRYGPTTRRPVGEITSIDQYGNRAWLDADQG